MPSVSFIGSLLGQLIAILLLVASITYVGYVPAQHDFPLICLPFCVAFLAYGYLLIRAERLWIILLTALGIRAILVFAFPNLSDDIYRFAWDGRLAHQGLSPYIHLPSELVGNEMDTSLDMYLYDQMNSKNYYTVYPPMSQYVFIISTWAPDHDIETISIIMKAILLIAEGLCLYIMITLLKLYSIPIKRVAIYALNPLVIIEIMGNVHFEGIMVMFFLLGWLLIVRQKLVLAAIPLALSVATKLFPLMLFPFIISYLGGRKAGLLFTCMSLVLLLLFYPIITHLNFFWESIDLYFQKFEFNASIYYALRWLGVQLTGYNQIAVIGPLLALITFSFIMYMSYVYSRVQKERIIQYWLLSFSLYLILATTVHPWYLIFPIALCVFTRFRYPVVWSGLILLSYISYAYEPFQENLWIVTFQYLMVFLVIAVECVGKRNIPHPQAITSKPSE